MSGEECAFPTAAEQYAGEFIAEYSEKECFTPRQLAALCGVADRVVYGAYAMGLLPEPACLVGDDPRWDHQAILDAAPTLKVAMQSAAAAIATPLVGAAPPAAPVKDASQLAEEIMQHERFRALTRNWRDTAVWRGGETFHTP